MSTTFWIQLVMLQTTLLHLLELVKSGILHQCPDFGPKKLSAEVRVVSFRLMSERLQRSRRCGTVVGPLKVLNLRPQTSCVVYESRRIASANGVNDQKKRNIGDFSVNDFVVIISFDDVQPKKSNEFCFFLRLCGGLCFCRSR